MFFMVIIDIVVNTLLARLTLDPAGMHCPAWDQGRIKALRGPRPIPNSSRGYIYTVWEKIGDFRRKSPFIHVTVRDRPGNNPKHFFTLFMRHTIAMPTHFLNFA